MNKYTYNYYEGHLDYRCSRNIPSTATKYIIEGLAHAGRTDIMLLANNAKIAKMEIDYLKGKITLFLVDETDQSRNWGDGQNMYEWLEKHLIEAYNNKKTVSCDFTITVYSRD